MSALLLNGLYIYIYLGALCLSVFWGIAFEVSKRLES
jgi:hypothetical protein